MKNILIASVLFLILLPSFASAATINAASCSQQDVKNAINSASDGDTIMVPEGSCVWTSGSRFISGGMYVYPSFGINKSIMLQGAGAGKTVITCMTNFNYTIIYRPANMSGNLPFRVTGFTFDMANQSYGIVVSATHSSDLTVQNKIRIDHNIFANVPGYEQAILNDGMRGVVDNNVFENIIYPMRPASSYRNGKEWWDAWDGIIFGAADNNMYFEDNVFNGTTVVSDCQYANRYAYRYNTITTASDSYPFFDMHGNQGEGNMYSCFGGEIYGNLINANSYAVDLLDHRGGKAVVFNNYVNTSYTSWIQVREEYDDARNPTTNQPQHVSDSYYWNNYERDMTPIRASIPIGQSGTATGGGNNYLEDLSANFPSAYANPDYLITIRYGLEIVGGTGAGQHRLIIGATPTRLNVTPNWTVNPDMTSQYRVLSDCCDAISENSEFYNQNTSFNGMSGIGCGPLSSRPATCTPGVGYWATNQNCLGIDAENVGAHPAIPVQGTLYKCTAANTWTAYYKPYIYPHPLTVAPFGTDICGEGAIASSCWCEGMKSDSYCCNGYYQTSECGAAETCDQYKRINATTMQACSCSYEDVQAVVNSAQSGDTVLVPAGSCIWNNQLVITKGIILIGAGIGNTVITSNYNALNPSNGADSGNYFIYYNCINPAANEPFRISGFTFDLASKCSFIKIYNFATTVINKVRVDHLNIVNSSNWVILIHGTVYGVMDNCDVNNGAVYFRGLAADTWKYQTFDFGTADNFYVEDCTFQFSNFLEYSGMGARWCLRHNTIDGTKSSTGIYPLCDAHGNRASNGGYSVIGVEVYENVINSGSVSGTYLDLRGGKGLLYNNNWVTTGSVTTKCTEENIDDESPPANNLISGQPQHVSDSYYWNNRKNNATKILQYIANTIDYGEPEGIVPRENVHIWFEPDAPFNGTVGVGFGLFANRPSSCTIGVGYWATDMKTLYKCTATNTWSLYYTPYTYPHPLRTDCVNYPELCDSGSSPPEPVPGDLNGNGVVDISDLSFIGTHFGQKNTHPLWNATVDVVANNEIDVYDVVFVASRFM